MNRKKILVVDDEPDIITYLDVLLENNGYRMLQARSAQEAFSVLKMIKPDLICLDIMLPKKSGLALYCDLKLDEDLKDIPTIFMSAFSLARDFQGKGFRNLIPDPRVPEPEAFMEKPVKAEKLIEIIKQTID